MHKYKFTSPELLREDFDIMNLSLSEEEIQTFRSKVSKLRKEYDLLIGSKPNSYHSWPSFFANRFVFSDSEVLSMVMVPNLRDILLKDFSLADYSTNSVLFNIIVSGLEEESDRTKRSIMSMNLITKMCDDYIRRYCLDMKHLSWKHKEEFFISLPVERAERVGEGFVLDMIQFVDGDKVTKYKKSNNASIRLAAYKKLGIGKHIDDMIKDTSAEVRKIAIEHMDYSDERLKKFTKEKTKGVFLLALLKCPKEMLPLFMINNMIRNDDSIRALFAKRMNEK